MQTSNVEYLRTQPGTTPTVFASPGGPVQLAEALMTLARGVSALERRLDALENQKGGK
ncbi:MAG: hypothetical protein HYX52_05815 [Chloroflexi bacterium]|nr:hypothetical protein [Chloroflexota bacterium]